MPNTKSKLKNKSLLALEAAWISITKFACGCWDTLDNLESAISDITNETSVQVNQRLYKENRRWLRNRKVLDQRACVMRQQAILLKTIKKCIDTLKIAYGKGL